MRNEKLVGGLAPPKKHRLLFSAAVVAESTGSPRTSSSNKKLRKLIRPSLTPISVRPPEEMDVSSSFQRAPDINDKKTLAKRLPTVCCRSWRQHRTPPSPSSSLSSPLRSASSPLSTASGSGALRHCITVPPSPQLARGRRTGSTIMCGGEGIGVSQERAWGTLVAGKGALVWERQVFFLSCA